MEIKSFIYCQSFNDKVGPKPKALDSWIGPLKIKQQSPHHVSCIYLKIG